MSDTCHRADGGFAEKRGNDSGTDKPLLLRKQDLANTIQSAESVLAIVRQETDHVGVALSFGKDSLVTLDLCARRFDRVSAYYMTRLENLRCVREWREKVCACYSNVTIAEMPHFDLARIHRHGILGASKKTKPTAKYLRDIEATFRAKKKVEWIAYGWRRGDSFSRAIILRRYGRLDFSSGRFFPIGFFRRQHIIAYLAWRGIKVPKMGFAEQAGLDLNPCHLRWLRAHYPDDWQRWCACFPLADIWADVGDRQTRAVPGHARDPVHPPRDFFPAITPETPRI